MIYIIIGPTNHNPRPEGLCPDDIGLVDVTFFISSRGQGHDVRDKVKCTHSYIAAHCMYE